MWRDYHGTEYCRNSESLKMGDYKFFETWSNNIREKTLLKGAKQLSFGYITCDITPVRNSSYLANV